MPGVKAEFRFFLLEACAFRIYCDKYTLSLVDIARTTSLWIINGDFRSSITSPSKDRFSASRQTWLIAAASASTGALLRDRRALSQADSGQPGEAWQPCTLFPVQLVSVARVVSGLGPETETLKAQTQAWTRKAARGR